MKSFPSDHPLFPSMRSISKAKKKFSLSPCSVRMGWDRWWTRQIESKRSNRTSSIRLTHFEKWKKIENLTVRGENNRKCVDKLFVHLIICKFSWWTSVHLAHDECIRHTFCNHYLQKKNKDRIIKSIQEKFWLTNRRFLWDGKVVLSLHLGCEWLSLTNCSC